MGTNATEHTGSSLLNSVIARLTVTRGVTSGGGGTYHPQFSVVSSVNLNSVTFVGKYMHVFFMTLSKDC